MRDEILETISMQDILEKYGIEYRNTKLRCPFHGEDRRPSAKAYEKNFHCFACQRHFDVIGFVEEYFNLSFKEAMQKINLDFNMGLDPHTPVDYKKLNKIKSEQYERKKIKEKQIRKYCNLCDVKIYYEKMITYFSKKINIKNWEKLESVISYFKTKLFLINQELDILDDKLSSRN